MTDLTTHHGRAMGSTVAIQVHGDPALVPIGLRRINELESQWSRFLANSEISRCNATRGMPVFVSADTRRLVRRGVRAWERTGGACDPSVLDVLVSAGYDRSFDELVAGREIGEPTRAQVPGCAGIEVDDELGSVTLPLDTGFDPGAIGKGLAADIVAEELMAAEATGVFVSLGGDIRAIGTPPGGDGWAIDVYEPCVRAEPVGTIVLTEGGVATSTDRKRRWRHHGVEHHHVIDPRTAMSAVDTPALVTTIAGAAWWAEALATQLMLCAPADWARITGDDGALIVDAAGATHVVGRMREHLR